MPLSAPMHNARRTRRSGCHFRKRSCRRSGKRIEHGGAGREPWRGVDGRAGIGHRHRVMGRCGVGRKVLHANTAAARICVPHDFLGDGAFIEIPWTGLGEAF